MLIMFLSADNRHESKAAVEGPEATISPPVSICVQRPLTLHHNGEDWKLISEENIQRNVSLSWRVFRAPCTLAYMHLYTIVSGRKSAAVS